MLQNIAKKTPNRLKGRRHKFNIDKDVDYFKNEMRFL